MDRSINEIKMDNNVMILLSTLVLPLLVSGFSTGRLKRFNFHNTHHVNRKIQAEVKSTELFSSLNQGNDGSFSKLSITGASVSSLGFLVVVDSLFVDAAADEDEQQQQKIAFPIQLTSSGTPPVISKTDKDASNNMTIPSLFEENIDQSSVTTPEALTFLQLINGVDMATPILPPDTLSLICVWYAFLLDNQTQEEPVVIEIEDELGLGSTASSNPDDFYPALEYIRSFVQTMVSDVGGKSESKNYLNISQWQRGKVRLPSVSLLGVRVEELENKHTTAIREQSAAEINTIPLKFVLECSVDDGSKLLEVTLFAVPESFDSDMFGSKGAVALSREVLKKLSQNYNTETSAAFIALSLFHRYRRSKGATLKVSQDLLQHLSCLQKLENGRYCWITESQDGGEGISLNKIIRAMGLPSFRTLLDLQESDKRVLGYLEEQNFGNDPSKSGKNNPTKSISAANNSNQSKKALTVEQLATQQKLKSAWKVATEKNDTAALEKIQKAMHDFEQQLEDAQRVADKETSLQKIRRAMKERRDDEDVVSLVSELEDAIDDNEFDGDR